MRTLEELPPEIKDLAQRVNKIRGTNASRIHRLEQVGVGLETANARLDHFIDGMVEAEIMTDEQVYGIHLKWEESLAEQLEKVEAAVTIRLNQQQRQEHDKTLAVVKNSGLVGPGGQPLKS